jgi:hypothetical protein
MKRILFITSQYRVGERIYPIIPLLAKEYIVDLLTVYQMSDSFNWTGNIDLRETFKKTYLNYFTNIYDIKCDSSVYDLIISDDNRITTKTSLESIYKNANCPFIACSHGNEDSKFTTMGYKRVYDYTFVFGKKERHTEWCIDIGIPSNDQLKKYHDSAKEHILIIVNFLGNRSAICPVRFDEIFFNNKNLKDLQCYYKLPIIIKLKSRADEGSYINNVQYLNQIIKDLNYKIVVDIEDDNELIAKSICVISAPSTLALKPIQLGIPTVLIRDAGQYGVLSNYDGIFNINENFLTYLQTYQRKTAFIQETITGGIDYSSTYVMLNKIKEIINHDNRTNITGN